MCYNVGTMRTAFEFLYSVFGFIVNWILFTLFGVLAAIPIGTILFCLTLVVLPFAVLFQWIWKAVGEFHREFNPSRD